MRYFCRQSTRSISGRVARSIGVKLWTLGWYLDCLIGGVLGRLILSGIFLQQLKGIKLCTDSTRNFDLIGVLLECKPIVCRDYIWHMNLLVE